jgi:hypothetical protein
MTTFNGDKIISKVIVHAGGKTFSRLFYTGAIAICMNATSFQTACQEKLPRKIKKNLRTALLPQEIK